MQEDEELEQIRKRRLEELRRYQQQKGLEEEQLAEIRAERQAILRKILTSEARERLGRLELAHPDLVQGIEDQLIALAQSGRVQSVIDDPTLRKLLRKLVPQKREIRIVRK